MKNLVYTLFLILVFTACNTGNKDESSFNNCFLKSIPAKGVWQIPDSFTKPQVIPIDESKLVKIPAGKPTVKPTNLNVHIAGAPKEILAGITKVTPGTDTFLLTKTIRAIGKIKPVVQPEMVIAKDMVNKDQNPQNLAHMVNCKG